MKNTVARGSEAELYFALLATRRGFSISTPITHNNEYDCIIDDGNNLFRIQVKRAYQTSVHGYMRWCVETRRIVVKHSGAKGATSQLYSENGYDFLVAVNCDNGTCWIIPRKEAAKNKAQIYLGKEKQAFLENWELLVKSLPKDAL